MEAAGLAWDAAADRSSWAITLGNPGTARRCAAAEAEAARQAADVQDLTRAELPDQDAVREVEGVAASTAGWFAHASGGSVRPCPPSRDV